MPDSPSPGSAPASLIISPVMEQKQPRPSGFWCFLSCLMLPARQAAFGHPLQLRKASHGRLDTNSVARHRRRALPHKRHNRRELDQELLKKFSRKECLLTAVSASERPHTLNSGEPRKGKITGHRFLGTGSPAQSRGIGLDLRPSLGNPTARRKSMKHRSHILGLALLTFATLGVAQAQSGPSAKAEERIIREVRHELLMLPYFGVFDNIAFKVDGYNVTLLGQVVRPSLKSDAENAVKHIEGVEKVDNQIEVLPPSPMDDRLRLTLYRAIYGYPALEKYALGVQKPIRIIVNNGHVTLEGVVDNAGDKNLAGMRANSVPGIFSVNNNLQVVAP